MPEHDDEDGRDLWRRYAAAREGAPSGERCPDVAALAGFLDGTIGESERARLETHLARCSRCLAAIDEARAAEQARFEPLTREGIDRLTRAIVAEQRGGRRVLHWLPVAAAVVFTCGVGFWLGARTATQAAAVRSGISASPFGLESLPVVNLP
jgi:anti-sigma factor RsiW